MQQTDRGSYKTEKSVVKMFYHSCLGKLVILGGIVGVLLLLAYISVPDEETMMNETMDNIYQCIAANDSIQRDWIDDAIGNVGNMFTHADSMPNEATMRTFEKYNRLEYQRHSFHSTAVIYNNFRPTGTVVGYGLFGMVIPTVNFNDFLLRISPIHKGYNQRLLDGPRLNRVDQEYFGENPELGIFKGDGSSH
jgi:hypothetical protein